MKVPAIVEFGSAVILGAAIAYILFGELSKDENHSRQSFVPAIMTCKVHEVDEEYVDMMCRVRVKKDWVEAHQDQLVAPRPDVEEEQTKWRVTYQL